MKRGKNDNKTPSPHLNVRFKTTKAVSLQCCLMNPLSDKGAAPTQVASASDPLPLPAPRPTFLWRLIMLPLFSNLIGSSQITYLDNKRRPINRRS